MLTGSRIWREPRWLDSRLSRVRTSSSSSSSSFQGSHTTKELFLLTSFKNRQAWLFASKPLFFFLIPYIPSPLALSNHSICQLPRDPIPHFLRSLFLSLALSAPFMPFHLRLAYSDCIPVVRWVEHDARFHSPPADTASHFFKTWTPILTFISTKSYFFRINFSVAWRTIAVPINVLFLNRIKIDNLSKWSLARNPLSY